MLLKGSSEQKSCFLCLFLLLLSNNWEGRRGFVSSRVCTRVTIVCFHLGWLYTFFFDLSMSLTLKEGWEGCLIEEKITQWSVASQQQKRTRVKTTCFSFLCITSVLSALKHCLLLSWTLKAFSFRFNSLQNIFP